MVHPYYEYCNVIWAAHGSKHLDKLIRSQKKILRIVHKLKWNSHTKQIFIDMNLLNVAHINTLQTALVMYKATKGLLPPQLNNLFTVNSKIHSHFTRRCNNVHVVRHRTKVREHSIRIRGTNLWNSISIELRNAPALSIFKRKFKSFIVNQSCNV